MELWLYGVTGLGAMVFLTVCTFVSYWIYRCSQNPQIVQQNPQIIPTELMQIPVVSNPINSTPNITVAAEGPQSSNVSNVSVVNPIEGLDAGRKVGAHDQSHRASENMIKCSYCSGGVVPRICGQCNQPVVGCSECLRNLSQCNCTEEQRESGKQRIDSQPKHVHLDDMNVTADKLIAAAKNRGNQTTTDRNLAADTTSNPDIIKRSSPKEEHLIPRNHNHGEYRMMHVEEMKDQSQSPDSELYVGQNENVVQQNEGNQPFFDNDHNVRDQQIQTLREQLKACLTMVNTLTQKEEPNNHGKSYGESGVSNVQSSQNPMIPYKDFDYSSERSPHTKNGDFRSVNNQSLKDQLAASMNQISDLASNLSILPEQNNSIPKIDEHQNKWEGTHQEQQESQYDREESDPLEKQRKMLDRIDRILNQSPDTSEWVMDVNDLAGVSANDIVKE